MGNSANSEDPDNAAFHQRLHCLLRLTQHSGTEIHHNLETLTCDPIKYKMGNPILIVSINMYGKIHQNTKGKEANEI